MSTWALIPTKSFEDGKSRLSEVLTDQNRRTFAAQLFEHVVRAAQHAEAIDKVAVVTAADDVRRLALELGAIVLNERDDDSNLADIVDHSLSDLRSRGATKAVVCMADLPELTANDLDRIVFALGEADVVLVPDLERLGTNVLALSPPTAMPSCFGHRDSFARHMRKARQLGLHEAVYFTHGGSFDVDRPVDLDRMSSLPRLRGAIEADFDQPMSRLKSKLFFRDLWALAWPLILARSSQAVVGLCDAAMVAPLGDASLAATTTGAFNVYAVIIFPMGIVMMVQSFSSQLKGEGRPEAARRFAYYALLIAVIAALIVGASLPFLGVIASRLGYEASVATGIADYMRVRLFATVFILGVEAIGNWFSGIGDTKTPMIAGLFVMVSNIVLNWFFIEGHGGAPAWGIEGAAFASGAASALGFLYLAFSFARTSFGKSHLKLKSAEFCALFDTVSHPERVGFSIFGVRCLHQCRRDTPRNEQPRGDDARFQYQRRLVHAGFCYRFRRSGSRRSRDRPG
ncbi:MAG: 2-phospho-L-lactate guanylyltransferase [Polyangiales bacterium]